MKTFHDFNCFYINLERRPEKRKFMEEQFNRLKLKVERVEGIDGQTLPDLEKDRLINELVVRWNTKQERQLGRIGCCLSHFKALKIALDRGLNNILIFEDDVNILGHTLTNLPQDSGILYLGGMVDSKAKIKPKENLDNWTEIKDYRFFGAIAYIIIGKENIKWVYDRVTTPRMRAIDILYTREIQKYKPCYFIKKTTPNFTFDSDCTFIGSTKPTLYGGRY
tara:strand:- start:323 stop:988 length:666 start_codon:yes stop_codon:yes gene_type:complete